MSKNQKQLRLLSYRQSLKAQGSVTCGLCHKPIIHQSDLTVDHIIPVSKGGTGESRNLQPAHESCNYQKGNRTLIIPNLTKTEKIE